MRQRTSPRGVDGVVFPTLVHIILLLILGASSVRCATVLTPIPEKKSAPAFEDPHIARVFVIVLENGDPSEAAKLSFVKRLASTGMVLNQYYAVAHPSQPNYIAMISGSTTGVPGDSNVTLTRKHIGQLLGSTWKVYAEDYPAKTATCNLTRKQGDYVRRHVPFLSFDDVQKSSCGNIVAEDAKASRLRADIDANQLPNLILFIPNLKHDGHSPSNLTIANAWLEAAIAPLLTKPTFTKDLLFVLTFDEDDNSGPNVPNRVYTVLWGDHVKSGTSNDVYDHFDLLTTIEALLHTPALPTDKPSRPIGGVWK